jgi:hypothetical protein
MIKKRRTGKKYVDLDWIMIEFNVGRSVGMKAKKLLELELN